MSEKIVVPILGESITEATVSKWLKNVGDEIEVDEALVELETDKVNIEVPSPVKGILSEIKFDNGKTVEVGSELGTIEPNEENEENKENTKKNITEEAKKNLDVEEETEKNISIFEKKELKTQDDNNNDEKPLILSEEIKEADTANQSSMNENLSP